MLKKLSILKAVGIMSAFTIFGISASLYSVNSSGAFQANAFQATAQIGKISTNNQISEVDFFLKSQDQLEIERKNQQKVRVKR